MRLHTVGQRLRELREKLRLTLKDVETQSRTIAQQRDNIEYLFTAGRLSQVENSNSLPSMYKLATLSEIYRVPFASLLLLYGIEMTPATETSEKAAAGKVATRPVLGTA